MKTLKKLKSKTGETLAEILVAILIIALSAGLFATLYVAAMNINLSAREEDEKLFDSVGKLEEDIHNGGTDGKSSGSIQYKPEDGTGTEDDITVDFYTQDGMTVYKESTTGAGGGSGGGTGGGTETPGEGG